ncbi:MAG: histone deacetylase [Bryobacteraceae bacterium]
MLPFKLVYHPGYDLNLGEHVFPARKYRLIHAHLLASGFATPEDFLTPSPIEVDDLLLVHDRGWIQRLRTGTLGYHEILKLEIPYSSLMVEAFWLAAGGTLLAASRALDDGAGFNIGGGFHHAFAAHGEGFCAIHDVAVAARALQKRGRVERVMIADCDVHHGNGTASIFAGDSSVLTLSIHQFQNYPEEKPPSTIDIHLADGVGDDEYLHRLGAAMRTALDGFRPGLLLYVAGADPYGEDQLGGLSLTMDGLSRRDRLVLGEARSRGIPVAVTLAGGYALRTEDTVRIHCNTAAVVRDVLLGK